MNTLAGMLTVGAAVLGAWLGTNHTRTSYYCQACGMRAVRHQREWLNLPFQNSFRAFDTRYSTMYQRVVTPSCPHQWTFSSSRSSGNILRGGENGCGAYPYALRFDGYYPRLEVLKPEQAAAILKALPLQPVVDWEQQRAIMGALDELGMGGVSHADARDEAQQWWDKYQHLFTPSTESEPETTPAASPEATPGE